MNYPWFKRTGIFFLPRSFFGWIIFFVSVIVAIYSFIDIDSRSHSASDTLMNFFFYLLIIGAVYSLIAFFTSKRTNS